MYWINSWHNCFLCLFDGLLMPGLSEYTSAKSKVLKHSDLVNLGCILHTNYAYKNPWLAKMKTYCLTDYKKLWFKHWKCVVLELKLCFSYFDLKYLKSCANVHSVNAGGGSNTGFTHAFFCMHEFFSLIFFYYFIDICVNKFKRNQT